MNNFAITKNLIKILSSLPVSIITLLAVFIVMSLNYSTNLADFGDYIKAGSLITDRINPYEQLMYANSPISALFFYLVDWILPFPILPIMIHLLNTIGALFFLRWYVGQRFNALYLILFAITLILGVGRALFGNVQVTGITLGLVALAFILNKKLKSPYFSLSVLLLALEIKPQITIPFIVLFIFQRTGVLKKVTYLFFSALTLHVTVELYFGGNLHFTWLEKVLRYSRNSTLQSSYEISIWKGINQIIDQPQFLRVISVLSIVITLFLVARYSKLNPEKAVFLALIFPVFNSYVHLYDYVGILLIAIKYANLKRLESLILIVPFFFFFPVSKNSFLLSMMIELVVISALVLRLKSRAFIWVGVGLVISQIIAYSLVLNLNQEIQMSIYLSLYTVFLSYYVYRNIFRRVAIPSDLK
jgi:hypothetical protein